MPPETTQAPVKLDARSLDLRRRILQVLGAAGRGHLGPALSIVEILRVLFDDVLRYRPEDPRWPGRDRFILSKGHGCLALYVLLAEKGFFAEAELARFCKKGSFLAGHPVHEIPGVELSTGSLGHGLSVGVGFALNARYEQAEHRVFVLIGDGESNEGSIWEAALCAAKHRLSNLTVIVDYNKQQSYGSTFEVLDLEPLVAKWASFGFATAEVDGHDVAALRALFWRLPLGPAQPTALICHTVKGRGVREAEGNPNWHHRARISSEDVDKLIAVLEDIDA